MRNQRNQTQDEVVVMRGPVAQLVRAGDLGESSLNESIRTARFKWVAFAFLMRA